MTENRKNIIGFTILFLCVGTGLYLAFRERNSIVAHKGITSGKIIELTSSSKSPEVFVRFKYIVGQNLYEGLSSLPNTEKNKHLKPLSVLLLNKVFPVVYDSTEKTNVEVLISAKQYERFKINPTDSIKAMTEMYKRIIKSNNR